MASRQSRLFEELNLREVAEPTNPYEILGIDPDFARQLLKEDPGGDALKVFASGIHRILSRRYHPDTLNTGNRERFQAITDAEDRIQTAASSSLSRWSRVERTAKSAKLEQLTAEREALIGHFAGMVTTNMEAGWKPQHFSQLTWTQGLLLERNRKRYLMRHQENGMRVTQGISATNSGALPLEVKEAGFSFESFLKVHDFDLQPGTAIAAYIDEKGRASILSPDLTFLMDVTGPVNQYRENRKTFSKDTLADLAGVDSWLRAEYPVLFQTTVPGATDTPTEGLTTVFPEHLGSRVDDPRSTNWDMDLEVVGSLSEVNYFARMRHAKQTGAAAIRAAKRTQGRNYFKLATLPTRQLVEDDAGYTPLLSAGNSLLLYDPNLGMPVATDAKIIGLIGSNSQAV